ncbi:MAG: hypothetical protein PHP98_10340 [Kiritimatiellae bacterium]|nr:hypothetical protein [Kiritimatiellia bacterium]
MKSYLTKEFRLCFANLPERIQRLARENYKIWKHNPYHPSLSFKRVGKRYPTYSVRIGLGWRALGFREDDDTLVWFWIGSHANYERRIQQL